MASPSSVFWKEVPARCLRLFTGLSCRHDVPNDGAIAPQLTLAFGVASKELISQVDGSWCLTFFIQLEKVCFVIDLRTRKAFIFRELYTALFFGNKFNFRLRSSFFFLLLGLEKLV